MDKNKIEPLNCMLYYAQKNKEDLERDYDNSQDRYFDP